MRDTMSGDGQFGESAPWLAAEPQPFRRELARIDDPDVVDGNTPGHRARHLIDGRNPADADPFLVLAEDWMPRGAFPLHPHRGMETVTFVIAGAIEHRDSAGHEGVLLPGDVQWMTAGRGVQHEENPPEGTMAHTLQLWVNLPADRKMSEPRYQDLRGSAMPVRREPGVEARVFSGRSGEVTSTTLNHVPVTLVDARIEAGAVFHQRLPATDRAFVYLLAGAVRLSEAEAMVTCGQLAWLTGSDRPGCSDVTVEAMGEGARILIASGRPLREPIAFGGPFVMNTQAEIRQAFADYRAARF
jgi:redox-sensitive bicupin YhaK (pirin superfamily)